MLTYPDIDPVAVAIGPLKVHWYGITYLVGFVAAGLHPAVARRARPGRPGPRADMVDDCSSTGVLGVPRRRPPRLHPLLWFRPDHSGTNPRNTCSRSGRAACPSTAACIGVLIAIGLFARKYGLRFFRVGEFLVPLVPLGLLAGRIGNFINGELWGHATSVAWGMRLPCEHFPSACAGLPLDAAWSLPLHASQLYEATLEGLVLFFVLWWFSSRPRPLMAVSGLFLLLYGLFRFGVEFVRLPDAHRLSRLRLAHHGPGAGGPIILAPGGLFGLAPVAETPRQRPEAGGFALVPAA